ncbi:hypothetical protein KJ562_02625 [Patescibacteria group bacterium]|nr:hypothetical protein [Patescibacteria group bacterium]MBU4162223.1 hypothetical protein [Patescibacteria group bacterium]
MKAKSSKKNHSLKNQIISIIIGFCLGITITLLFIFLFTDSFSYLKVDIVDVIDDEATYDVNDAEPDVPDSSVDDMSCETGFADIGTYCIQIDEANSGDILDWYAAWDYCVDNYDGARLCEFNEWYQSCLDGVLTNGIDDYEWVDNWCEHGDVNVVGSGSCQNVENFESATSNSRAFRCCK